MLKLGVILKRAFNENEPKMDSTGTQKGPKKVTQIEGKGKIGPGRPLDTKMEPKWTQNGAKWMPK